MEINRIIKILNEIVHSRKTLERARLSEKYFTRKRKMSFTDVLSFFFDLRKTSLQTRLNLFSKKEHQMISQQAFSKARSHFDHSPFETMVRTLVQQEYRENSEQLPTWNGYHVFAVDGSYLQLPKTAELREAFGVRGQGGHCVSAGISVLYDVLHGWPLDPIITHSKMNERKECEKHLDFLSRELPEIAGDSLVLLDRGYPSKELLEHFEAAGVKYLARCKSNYCKAVETAPVGDSIITLNGLTVRVYKGTLKSGDTETLLTNLFEIPADEFPHLYSMRWGIETAYNQLKNIVCLENFSGRTENAVRQDFWASMVLMICVAVFEKEANNRIALSQRTKSNKHSYKVNTGDLVVSLRDEFVFQVLRSNKLFSMFRIKKIIKILAYSKSPIRNDRSFPRHSSRFVPFNLLLKSHL